MNIKKLIVIFPLLLFCHLAFSEEQKSIEASSTENNVQDEVANRINTFTQQIQAEHLSFIEQIEVKKEIILKLQNELQAFASKDNTESIEKKYFDISNVWSQSVDQLFDVFTDSNLKSKIDSLEFTLYDEQMDIDSNEKKYSIANKEAKLKQAKFVTERQNILDEYKVLTLKVLQESGKMRAKLLRQCDEISCGIPRGLSSKNLELLIHELKAVPLKLTVGGLRKWMEVRTKFSSGIDGWLDLSKQSFLLMILLLIPFVLIKTLRWTSIRLSLWKKNLLSKSIMDYKRRTSLAVWIGRLNPFVFSTGMFLSLAVGRIVIERTDLYEVSQFLFYFQIYFIYSFVRVLLGIVLEMIFTTDSINEVRKQKDLISKSATRISRLVFIEFLLLQIIEDAVRQALAYHFLTSFIFWINILFIFAESKRWKREIEISFQLKFSFLDEKLKFILNRKIGDLFLPAMFFLLMATAAYHFIYSHLIRFDLVKRGVSELFKQQLERSEKEPDSHLAVTPPQDYLSYFDYYLEADSNTLVTLRDEVVDKSKEKVFSWIDGKSNDDLLIIVGNRGLGKSTTVKHIYQYVLEKIGSENVFYERLTKKLLGPEDVFQWLSDFFKVEIDSIDAVQKLDNNLDRKIVLCVDDIHNLFLGYVGGFYAYRTFLEIINLKTKNLYWCLTVNSRSWMYLKGVLGQEHFYGQVLTLGPWKDYEIQKLILSRHERTGYSKTFDRSIKAYSSGDDIGQQVETQFFRLLWGQARGNPRSALMYWVSAISSPAPKQIHVGIPLFVSSLHVSSMSDEALFILSAIARHDNLTQKELNQITNIQHLVVRKCLKEAEDKELIWQDEYGCFRVSSRAQNVIDYFLIGKNFLYE
jgi:hypothetical protein